MKKYKLAFNSDDETLSPVDCIELMFRHTGILSRLYVPDWYGESDGNTCLRLDMTWNENEKNEAVSAFEKLYSQLKEIASVYDRLEDTLEENKTVLSPELLEVWNTYVRDFETGDLDLEKICDISERKDACERVTDEEEALYKIYRDAVYKDAESRLENKLAAYDAVIRAKRVCKLMSLNAPEIIINNEAKLLAQAIAVNRFGDGLERVENV